MAHKKGVYLGGIRTLEDLRIRCRMDEETGCWVWGMGDAGKGVPCVSLRIDGKPTSVNGRRAALLLAGPMPTKKVVASSRPSCVNKMCVNPDHSQWLTLRTCAIRTAKKPETIEKLRRNGVASRGRLAKLTEAQVIEIRHSAEKIKDLAERYGVSKNAVLNIRHYRAWSDVGMPKGASVFSLSSHA